MSIPLALKPAPVLASRAPGIDASLWPGVAVGLLAASIGALYTVFARWGMAQGLAASDMTVLRFAVAGLVTLPVLLGAIYLDAAGFLARWRVWLAVSLLAGPLFGLLMFSALHWAPASHAAVFPFTAMSLMGTLMSVWFLGDKLTWRKVVGMAVVASGLCVLADLSLASFSWRSLLGDAMFIAAGSLWAGFGIVMRRERLDPLLATATISFFALMTYVPAYAVLVGPARLMAASATVLWTEVLVQGLIAGAGTLYTYSRMVALLGPARAAVFPALAPAIAALLAWPVLGHVPGMGEITGMVLAMTGIVITVTAGTGSASPSKNT